MEDTKLGHPTGPQLLDLLMAIACVHKVKPQLKNQEGSDSGHERAGISCILDLNFSHGIIVYL